MTSIVRFFRRLFHLNQSDNVHNQAAYIIDNNLDEGPYESNIEKKCLANELFKEFFTYIGLLEDQEYFGFRNQDHIWIDPLKELYKQHSSKPPHHFYFMVKFYPSDTQNLRDEMARYLMVKEISKDILNGKLQTDNKDLLTDLAALLLQSWYGNYSVRNNDLKFVTSHDFIPKPTKEFYKGVLEKYKKFKNLVPSAAESQFLNKVSRIPLFGVDWHDVRGKNDVEIRLGLNPSGILVYEGDTNAGLFLWNQIENIILKWKKIKIVMEAVNEATQKIESSEFVFRSNNSEKTKELFKSCVEYHIFYQLTTSSMTKKKTSTGFFKRNTLFSLSSRTEFELHQKRSLGSSSLRRQKSNSNTKTLASQKVTRHQSMPGIKRTPSRNVSMKRP